MVKIFGYSFFEKSLPAQAARPSNRPVQDNQSTLQSIETSQSNSMGNCLMRVLARLMNLCLRLLDWLTSHRKPEAIESSSAQISSLAHLTPVQKDAVIKVLDILGNSGLPMIFARLPEIEELTSLTENTHPFQHMVFVASNETCKQNLLRVRAKFKNQMKAISPWHKMVGETRIELKKQLNQNNLWPHLEEFAKILQRDPKKIRSMIENAKKDSDWETLFNYLIDR